MHPCRENYPTILLGNMTMNLLETLLPHMGITVWLSELGLGDCLGFFICIHCYV